MAAIPVLFTSPCWIVKWPPILAAVSTHFYSLPIRVYSFDPFSFVPIHWNVTWFSLYFQITIFVHAHLHLRRLELARSLSCQWGAWPTFAHSVSLCPPDSLLLHILAHVNFRCGKTLPPFILPLFDKFSVWWMAVLLVLQNLTIMVKIGCQVDITVLDPTCVACLCIYSIWRLCWWYVRCNCYVDLW